MVARASERGPVGREITRTLDVKHAAILRKVGAERDQARLAALWDDLCGRGLIAGAYWAIMSHSHVAEPLKMHAFGEVHMLSHFMGGCNRHNVKELWLAQWRLDQLADTVARARRQAQETIAARDQKISELEHELRKARQQLATTHGGRPPRSPGTAPVGGLHRSGADRGGRRLAAARARLVALEADNQRLQALLGVLIETAQPKPAMAPEPGPIQAVAGDRAPQLEGRCILYVGGRSGRIVEGVPAASRRRTGGEPAIARAPGRPGRFRALPDRLCQPSGVPQGQGTVPPARQAVRTVAQQQRHLLRPSDQGLAGRAAG
jgi:hypothetical protein